MHMEVLLYARKMMGPPVPYEALRMAMIVLASVLPFFVGLFFLLFYKRAISCIRGISRLVSNYSIYSGKPKKR